MPYKDYNKKMKEYMLKRYHDRRAWALELLGGKCVECGSTDELEFDHIDSETKVKSFAKIWSYSKEKLKEEIKKLQLLCDPCHNEKSRGEISEMKKELWNKIKGV